MNLKAWVAQELAASGRTAFDFFNESWTRVHGSACRSNRIVLDAEKYRKKGDVPFYVARRWELLRAAQASIPERALKSSRWQDTSIHQNYRLVDDSPLLQAHKGADGVWRC